MRRCSNNSSIKTKTNKLDGHSYYYAVCVRLTCEKDVLRGLFFNSKVVSNMIVEIWNKNAGIFNSLVEKDRKVRVFIFNRLLNGVKLRMGVFVYFNRSQGRFVPSTIKLEGMFVSFKDTSKEVNVIHPNIFMFRRWLITVKPW
jgi:hypothetical protein